MLNRIVHPGPEGEPVLIVAHGLFGSGRNWGAVARRLAEGRTVVAVDMRNHGDSAQLPGMSYGEMAADLGEVIDALGGGRADLLGHSMGGKAAMVLALSAPGRVRRLVVADMAPVGYSHTQAHLVEAMRGLDLGAVGRRSEADALLRDRVPDPGLRAFLLQSLAIRDGAAEWKLNLPVLGAAMAEIIGFPEIAGRFDGPALFVTGAASDYVRPEHWERIRALFPRARSEVIAAAGHWLHADQPAAFAAVVDGFLRDPSVTD